MALKGPSTSPRVLLPELQRYKDTIRCAALGGEVPGDRQQQLTQTLIVRFLKTHLFILILDCETSTKPGFFRHFEKKLKAKKTQAEKKLKQIFEKLKQIIQKLNNLPT